MYLLMHLLIHLFIDAYTFRVPNLCLASCFLLVMMGASDTTLA